MLIECPRVHEVSKMLVTKYSVTTYMMLANRTLPFTFLKYILLI